MSESWYYGSGRVRERFCSARRSRVERDEEDAEKEAAKHLANLSDTPSDHDDAYVTDLDAVPPLSNDTRFAERGGRAHFTINDFEWIDLGPRLMIPGFVDAHVHAPQYGFMGLGVGLPLLQWLDKYTFPFESRFSDLGFATEMYSAAVVRIYFLSLSRIHIFESTLNVKNNNKH